MNTFSTCSIHIWENHHTVFIDMTNDSDSYEMRRFNKREYGDRLATEVAYHVNRIAQVTGAKWTNETTLDL